MNFRSPPPERTLAKIKVSPNAATGPGEQGQSGAMLVVDGGGTGFKGPGGMRHFKEWMGPSHTKASAREAISRTTERRSSRRSGAMG